MAAADSDAVRFFEWFGGFGFFCNKMVRAAFVPPFGGKELLRQLDEVGSKSLLLVALAGAATVVGISLETRDSLIRFGAKSLLPAVIVISIIKESGPIITGLIVAGRAGARIGAELSTMKVTHEHELKNNQDCTRALRPLGLLRERGQTMLVVNYTSGEPLDLLVQQPMEIGQFLRLSVGLPAAISQLHGLERHKDSRI